MRILHIKGKTSRWFEFNVTYTYRSNKVVVRETDIQAVEADGNDRSILTLGNKLVHVAEPYEEVLKALTLEERG